MRGVEVGMDGTGRSGVHGCLGGCNDCQPLLGMAVSVTKPTENAIY